MVKIALLNLEEPKNRNRWIIGTPEDIPKTSPFYSEQIQIAYVKNPQRGLLEKGEEHSHTSPIEEYYLVLEGTLTVKVEDKEITIKPNQILAIPPEKCHKITNFTLPLRCFTIRAPISTQKTKITE
jgi:mannose-6-phosphate isomerase-like protein (cupin superfamily)